MIDFGNTVGDDFDRDSTPDKYIECKPPMTPLDAAQAIIDSEKRVAELVELVKEAYEADPWCHDNDAICKPLPFEESDIALNLDRIMGKETHDER